MTHEAASLKLGVAKVDITPKHSIPLAGYAHRKGAAFETVAHPLCARIFYFEQTDETKATSKALLVQADLIWWGNERLPSLKKKIKEKWGIAESAMIFNASHTHSGPQTSDRFTALLGPPNREYLQAMEAELLKGIAEAIDQLESVSVERASGESHIGIQRRKNINGKYVHAPNPDGPFDPEVTVIRFRTKSQEAQDQDHLKQDLPAPDHRTKGVLFHYACHPTIMGKNIVSAEFPGVAMEQVEQELAGGAVAAFLQGCCGDVRPALFRDDRFYTGGKEDIERLGRILAAEVMRVLAEPMNDLSPSALTSHELKVHLQYEEVPRREELEKLTQADDVMGQWSRLLLEQPERLQKTIPLDLGIVTIAHGLSFLTMNGEVVVDYGLFIKSVSGKTVLPLAYSNGMIGYVPTKRQLVEGGYEAKDSLYYFGLVGKFSADIEDSIHEGINQLLHAAQIEC